MESESGFQPKVGEEYTVKIEAIGEKGDGIAKVNNFVIFVPETTEGEEVSVRVNKVFPKFAFSEKI